MATGKSPAPYKTLFHFFLWSVTPAVRAVCEIRATNVGILRKSAAALWLEARIGQRFDALVTGASEKGTWVRVLDPPVEGKLVQGFAGFDVGDRVRVKLTNVNVERGFIDFVGVS